MSHSGFRPLGPTHKGCSGIKCRRRHSALRSMQREYSSALSGTFEEPAFFEALFAALESDLPERLSKRNQKLKSISGIKTKFLKSQSTALSQSGLVINKIKCSKL